MNKKPDFFDNILLQKREELINMGQNPYPYDYTRSHSIDTVIKNEVQYTEIKESVSVVGRVTALRLMGKSMFFDLMDDTARLQIYAGKSDFSDEDWKILSKLMDIGDFLNITGFVFRTKMGELSIHAVKASIICKAVVRIPFGKSTDEKEYNEVTDCNIRSN